MDGGGGFVWLWLRGSRLVWLTDYKIWKFLILLNEEGLFSSSVLECARRYTYSPCHLVAGRVLMTSEGTGGQMWVCKLLLLDLRTKVVLKQEQIETILLLSVLLFSLGISTSYLNSFNAHIQCMYADWLSANRMGPGLFLVSRQCTSSDAADDDDGSVCVWQQLISRRGNSRNLTSLAGLTDVVCRWRFEQSGH